MRYFGSYPEPIWFNPNGIVNIMSLSNVSKYYQVKMNTSIKDCITLIKIDGEEVRFTPTAKDLYHYLVRHDDKDLWAFMMTLSSQADT